MKTRLSRLIPLLLTVSSLASTAFLYWDDIRIARHNITQNGIDDVNVNLTHLQNILDTQLASDNLQDARLSLAVSALHPGIETLLFADDKDRVMMAHRFMWVGSQATQVSQYDENIARQVRQTRESVVVADERKSMLRGYYPVMLRLRAGAADTDQIGLLFVEYNLSSKLAIARHTTLVHTLTYGGVMIAVALIITILLHVLVTRRMQKIVSTTQRFAEGDLDARVPIAGSDELAELGAAFNQMASQRKQIEEALRISEQQYRSMVVNTPGTLFLCELDAEWTVRYISNAVESLTGYPASDFVGNAVRSYASIIDADDVEMVERLVNTAITDGHPWEIEYRLRHADGSVRWVHEKGQAMITPEGKIDSLSGFIHDITERKHAEEHIHYLANFDPLTGLPNRTQLNNHLRYAINLAKRSNGHLVLMFLDLDHFKDINDTLGHSVGDALLVEMAKRLRLLLREEDTVTRLGGDEFILLLPGVDTRVAAYVAQKVLDAIIEPYQIEQYKLTLTASIGIALYPGDGEDLESLSKSADAAMYRAKQAGRQGYRFFTAEMQASSVRNLLLVNALRQALQHEQFQLYYQPQVSLQDEQIVGVEALLRWRHPELGMVSPAEFIPIAEDSGLILPIGEWVLRNAVRQLTAWMENGLPPLIIAVNLSAAQFRHPDLPNLVSRILEEYGLPPEYLELELTEGAAMQNPQSAIETMNKLHERGTRISIDDFGTGYSSLSYLKKFKAYKLKIDQSFIRDISTDAEDKAIVSAVISMAKSLGLQTIAEGVETAGQRAFLRGQGCDEMQGYLFSRPVPVEQLEALLKRGHPD